VGHAAATFETEALPAHRVVARFRFNDVGTRLPRVTWLILDRDEVDVRYRDPGFEADLVVVGRLRSLIGVWLGDLSMAAATRTGEIQIEGPPGCRSRVFALAPPQRVRER
jgi:hypothetical protein